MKIILKHDYPQLALLIVVSSIFYGSMFLNLNIFVESEILSKWYAIIAGAIICTLIIACSRNREIRYDKISIYMGVFIVFMLIRDIWANSATIKILLIFSFYLLFSFFRTNIIKNNHINVVIVSACLLESYLGISQFIDDKLVLGSFDNPSGFVACLSVGYPFCFIKEKQRFKIISYGKIITAILVPIVVVFSNSRTGIFAVSITLVITLYSLLKYKIHNKAFFLVTISIISIIGAIVLFLYKINSSIGRLFIWQNSLQIVFDKPIIGNGSGAFHSHYMSYQADYFANHNDSQFISLADNVTHPLNEFLHLAIDYGLIGVTMVIILVICIWQEKKTNEQFLPLLSIVLFSIFSYPLRYGFVLIIMAYVLSTITSGKTIHYNINHMTRVVLFFILTIGVILFAKDCKFEYQWSKLTIESYSKIDQTTIEKYEKLNTIYNNNPFFLYNYAAVLNNSGNYTLSNNILKICIKHINDYDTQMLMADNYIKMNNYIKAEECLVFARNMIPNRFIPLNELMKLYVKQEKIDKAIEIAHSILLMPIKVHSSTVTEIRKEAYDFIRNNETILFR